MKSKFSKVLALILACVMMLCIFSACGTGGQSTGKETEKSGTTGGQTSGQTSAAAPAARGQGKITVGSASANFVGHFDPDGVFSTQAGAIEKSLCYDAMLYVDPKTGEWDSLILKSWEWDKEDPTLLVMTLRDDVYFSNGDQMTGEDILYTLTRCAGSMDYMTLYTYVDMSRTHVDENDPLVVYLQFTDTFGPYETILRSQVVNKSWIEEHGGEDGIDWFDPKMICGSGPYEVTEFTQDISCTYKLRDDWWYAKEAGDDFCTVGEITTLAYTDASVMMVDYETGVLDLVINLSADDAKRVMDDNTLGTCAIIPSNYTAVIAMGVDNNPLFDNMDLRKAICHAIDSEAIAELAYGVLGSKATSTLPSSSPYYEDGHSYEYDPELAKQCMADSKLTDVTLKFVVASGNVDAVIAEAVASYLGAVGINVDLQVLDVGTAVPMWFQPGSTDLQTNCTTNGNATNEVTNVYEHYESTDMFACLARKNAELNELLTKGRLNTDKAVRSEIYGKVQDYFYDNYEIVPIAEWNLAYAYNDSISACSLADVFIPDLRWITAVS